MRGSFTVIKEVEVDIYFDDIPTSELVKELRNRIGTESPRLDYETIIKVLRADGCPEHILNPLMEWINEPVVNESKLVQWKELCSVRL